VINLDRVWLKTLCDDNAEDFILVGTEFVAGGLYSGLDNLTLTLPMDLR
jgi:hypothetical protein